MLIIDGHRIVEFGLGKVLVSRTKREPTENAVNTSTCNGILLEETNTVYEIGSIVRSEELELNDSHPIILAFHSIEGANVLRETLNEIIAAIQAEQIEK